MADSSLFRTTDDYMLEAISRVQEAGSKITDFNIGSGTRSLYEGFAAALSEHSAVAEQLRQDSYLATATGDALDRKAADNQVLRKPAAQATGSVQITRQATGQGLTIPAGWGNLLTIPAPGQSPLAYITTQDAVFPIGTATVTVTGVAVDGGVASNISQAPTALVDVVAINPIAGVATQGGYKLLGAWIGGVDIETDDELRVRVPIEVQGRVRGQQMSFLAGALSVVGVTSAQVLRNGDTRPGGTGTVANGDVEVYYKGDSSLQAAVVAAAKARAVLDQNVVVTQAVIERVIAALTVFALAGTDLTSLAARAKAAVLSVVNAAAVGANVPFSSVVQAVHAIDDVQSVAIPFAQFRLFAEAPGTCHDLTIPASHVASLLAADCVVTATAL